MPEELGTKDVLEQVDTRLGNVEGDIRDLRTEMNTRFTEMNTRFDRVYQEMAGLRGEMAARFRGVDQRFMWLYGLLVALLIGVAGLWLK